MTQQEKKEELIGLFLNGAITIGDLIDECFEFGQRHPHWTSVEDELPPYGHLRELLGDAEYNLQALHDIRDGWDTREED